MSYSETLRRRILSAMGAGLVIGSGVPLGCGGSEESVAPKSCSNGQPEVTCWPPGETHFNSGNVPPGTAPPPPDPVFDQNGCQITEQVRDGCCNAAVSGPELRDGQCCYGFCSGACCGRPLLVGGTPREAPVVERSDWRGAPLRIAGLAELATDTRLELVRKWLAEARMEHASIASFARFTLDLLAFGAPSDLVRCAARAQADEIQHASVCFAIASVYDGRAYGPGALNMDGVQASTSLAHAAVAAVREGCVGETVASLSARARGRGTRVSELCAVLERIADDEARHAELAWRFVRWAGQTGGPGVRAAIARAFRELSVPVPSATPARADDPLLRAHGCLPESEARELERVAILEVVEPCARALLSDLESAAPPSERKTSAMAQPA